MLPAKLDQFIESWGSMGVFWGINRSMARIHAFILVSEDAVDLDTIAEYLDISRGNASMCLKDLRQWGVIQRVHVKGERRDYYVAEPDASKMIFRIIAGRKQREFDPALSALRSVLAEVESKGDEFVYQRLIQIEEMLSALDGVLSRYLNSEESADAMLNFFKNFVLSQKEPQK
jgi:DNA-binding transcriptional regulator GbsR (MarR family)